MKINKWIWILLMIVLIILVTQYKKVGITYKEDPDSFSIIGNWYAQVANAGIDGNWDTWQYAYDTCWPCYLLVNRSRLDGNLWEIKYGGNSTISYLWYNITVPSVCESSTYQLGFEIYRDYHPVNTANNTLICYDYQSQKWIPFGIPIFSQGAYVSPRADRVYEERMWNILSDYLYFINQKDNYLSGTNNLNTFVTNANNWVNS